MARSTPNVFTIAPGQDFAAQLVKSLLAGEILSLPFAQEPLLLADLTIYVPTQRIRRVLEAAFAEALHPPAKWIPVGGQSGCDNKKREHGFDFIKTQRALAPRAAILPSIRPLAEPGDPFETLLDALDDPVTLEQRGIGDLERRFLLLEPILDWQARLAARRRETHGFAEIAGDVRLAESLSLAQALGRLIDEMRIDDRPLSSLASVAPDKYDPAKFDEYWSMTREFLRLAAEKWPQTLVDLNAEDESALRLARIAAHAARLGLGKSSRPVIVAGSTGSVEATAQLMRVVARLAQGAVILPGLDQALDEESWAAIGNTDATLATQFTHPQTSLKHALKTIGIHREDVTPLGEVSVALEARNRFVSEVLRPSETCAQWHITRKTCAFEAALAGLGVIEAADEREEALAIAIAMRETLEECGQSVALMTADRALAQRVTAELRRWAIHVEDSAGISLAQTRLGTFLRLALVAARERDAASILAMLRHPLFRLEQADQRAQHLADALELLVFRGRAFTRELPLGERVRLVLTDEERRPTGAARRIASDIRDDLIAFATALDGQLALFSLERPPTAFSQLAADALAMLNALTRENADETPLLDEIGHAGLVGALEDLARFGGERGLPPAHFLDVLDPVLTERRAPAKPVTHPRAAILGLLEARLISADRIILGGLNEGSFPPNAQSDPFLNRAMRLALGLPLPERRIGQAAHDFSMIAGAPDLLLTRARRIGGQPGLPSRFLRRMQAFAGETHWQSLLKSGERFRDLARRLDAPEAVTPIAAPNIVPQGRRIPQRLSITEIETLRRDPYAIYAKHILGLEPLEPLDSAPDARDRGTILHKILETYCASDLPQTDEDRQVMLRNIGLDLFRNIAEEPELYRFWWQKFEAIIPDFVSFDRERRAHLAHLLLEVRADYPLTLPSGETIRITGKADRIEQDKAGRLTMIDYKSGAPPSFKQIADGFAPQLPITAALAEKGGFAGLAAGSLCENIAYLPIGGQVLKLEERNPKSGALADLVQPRWQWLVDTLDALARGEQGYRARVAPFKKDEDGAYDHLARVREWSIISAEMDESSDETDGEKEA